MPTLLPLSPSLPRLPHSIELPGLRSYSIVGLDVSSNAAPAPGRVVMVLVRFGVPPGSGEQIGQVGGGRGVSSGSAGAVLRVDEEEGKEEGGEEDRGENYLQVLDWVFGGCV